MARLKKFPLFIGLLLLWTAGSRLAALEGVLATRTVPAERLIRNLETIAAKQPKDAGVRFNLARVHAMMFARKMATDGPVEVAPWEESTVPIIDIPPGPSTLVQTKDTERLKEAKRHLDVAIDLYRQGIALDPGDLTAKLGYAWCIDQSGDRAKAVTAYRQVIAEAWVKPPRPGRPSDTTSQSTVPQSTVIRLFGPPTENDMLLADAWGPITAEAAGYLIPLLDRKNDRDEIATLEDRVTRLKSRTARFISPIAIPLSENARPETFIDADARVVFDADGSGIPKPWTWITSEAAWLVHAPSRSIPVTSALQLFGNVTFWLFWENGYQALTALDDNGDGVLKGAELAGLGLWRDTNRNGIAEESEVKSLADWNIVSLDCAHENTRGHHDYVAYSPRGVTFKDGHTRPTWDVLLYTQPSSGAITE